MPRSSAHARTAAALFGPHSTGPSVSPVSTPSASTSGSVHSSPSTSRSSAAASTW